MKRVKELFLSLERKHTQHSIQHTRHVRKYSVHALLLSNHIYQSFTSLHLHSSFDVLGIQAVYEVVKVEAEDCMRDFEHVLEVEV
jgi:hypothetical protein